MTYREGRGKVKLGGGVAEERKGSGRSGGRMRRGEARRDKAWWDATRRRDETRPTRHRHYTRVLRSSQVRRRGPFLWRGFWGWGSWTAFISCQCTGCPQARRSRDNCSRALCRSPRAHFSEQTCRGHADARNRPCYKSALSNEDRARQTHEISGFFDNLRELLVGKLDE